MIAPQFVNVGAANLTRNISTIGALDDSMAGYDDEWIYATTMLVWDTARQSYTQYGWAGTSPETVDGMPELNNTWLDQSTEETDDTIDVGQGFWIKAAEAGTMTISGEVPSGNNIPAGGLVVDLVAGFNMVANPYPMEVPVSTFGQLDSSMAGYDDEWIYATTMLVWDNARQSYTQYGWAGTSPETVDGMPELNNTWLDQSTEETDDTIAQGASVWIKAATAGTITFPEL